MLVKTKGFSEPMLARFRALQRLSFSILETAAAELIEGQTEKEVARELVLRYRETGFTSFFHLPVVLFGERCALPGDWKLGNFFPKKKMLEDGDSVILDAAPICDGYLVDTSYSFCFGEDETHRAMMENLAGFRISIRDAVNDGQTFKAIADNVLKTFEALGYEPAHGKHPGEVLGHRAIKLPQLPFKWRVQGFDAAALGWFGVNERLAKLPLGAKSPLWNQSGNSDHPPYDGLWLVEPHAGHGEVGAKWEEILVIEEGNARWLDDDPPHKRQWAQISNGGDYRPQQPSRD